MRPTAFLAAAVLAFSSPVIAVAEDEPVPALDPVAIELVTQSAEFLAAQQNLSMNWFVSFDVVVDGREKITYLRSGSNTMSRGEGFYSYLERGDGVREFFYDGETFSISIPGDSAYVSAPFDGGYVALIQTLRDEYDVILPIWEMLTPKSGEELLDGVEAAAYLGTTFFAGREAHHIAFAEYSGDWQVWISTDPDAPVPLMVVGTDPYSQGWPQYSAYLSDWDFAPEIPEDRFTFAPQDGDVKISWPKIVEVYETEKQELQQGSKGRTQPSESGN